MKNKNGNPFFGVQYATPVKPICRALQVRTTSEADLREYVGEGMKDENGAFVFGDEIAEPDDYIFTTNGLEYHKADKEVFEACFDAHPYDYMNRRFGTIVDNRFAKLEEEWRELMQAYHASKDAEYAENLIEELADLHIITMHIAQLYGRSSQDLINLAFEKMKARELTPDYKRKHAHATCGNCLNCTTQVGYVKFCTFGYLIHNDNTEACEEYIPRPERKNAEPTPKVEVSIRKKYE